ncbi:uncharacterized protein M421DRAFT_358496 [Didymella exigua CBS 183.55]|uniref:Secreted protein n=1 Tax=Didymella exigua CBS 183.55 TaxID=1150837 RepID=A0A6A5RT70_9PLEO|nr:uncharacterized protein M421DRAFT_358496 [Didymella exigua CBS 183.55]KAF1930769.1 hypothetical protein M421DRAFT_358496 [Didymella exigua CBS 183.55]
MKMYQICTGTVLVLARAVLICSVCLRNHASDTAGNAPLTDTCLSRARTLGRAHTVVWTFLRCWVARRQVDCLRFGVLARSFFGEG